VGPAPAVAAVRIAVRRTLADVPNGPGQPVIVACSGGADSLALLAATVFEARREAWPVLGATVDHGLQEGSAQHAERVVAQMAALGADEAVCVPVTVAATGQGVEAAAREARYAALGEVAERTGASAVLLGHTLDDQAETVLLGLTRGSGARSLAGMRPVLGRFRRPLLEVSRAQTEAACRAEGIEFWTDPHNADPRFTRARVRHRVLPMLESELGPGVTAALARTADLLRDDVDALDRTARAAFEALTPPRRDGGSDTGPDGEPGAGSDVDLDVVRLLGLDRAVRLRVLRLAAARAGSPPGELFRVHLHAADALVTDYRGQQRIELPGHVSAVRDGAVLRFRRADGRTDA
jgi:tRNA(Ile)-lysidine synthase